VSNARVFFSSGAERIGRRIFANEMLFITQTRRAAEKEGMQVKKERIED
jgi:hypothetical protein